MAQFLSQPQRARNAAIVAAVRQGIPHRTVARLYGVSPSRVSALWADTKRRERFAQEHAESGGPARTRTLGGPGMEEPSCP
jgi:hypothetical protein